MSEGAAVPILMMALAFLSPFGVTTGIGCEDWFDQRLVAPVWVLHLSGPIAGAFAFDIAWLHLTSLDFLSQLLLAIAGSLYYLGVVSRKVVTLSGLVSPLVYMRGYLFPVGELELWMHYPIPVMLVIVLVIIVIHPARRDGGQPERVAAEAASEKGV